MTDPNPAPIRISPEIAARLDALAEQLGADERLKPYGRGASRAAVARLCLDLGIGLLEAETSEAAAVRSGDARTMARALAPYLARVLDDLAAARSEAATHGAQVVAAPEHPEGPWLVIRDEPYGFTLDSDLVDDALAGGGPEILAGGATPAEAVRRAFHGA